MNVLTEKNVCLLPINSVQNKLLYVYFLPFIRVICYCICVLTYHMN
jgi:hypothetical protein